MPSCDCLESENFRVLTQDCNSIWNVAEETPKSLCVLSEHSYLFILICVLIYWQCHVPCGIFSSPTKCRTFAPCIWSTES